MAEPKKKLSKTRTHLRRSNYKAEVVSFVNCSNCGKPIALHTICKYCGFYKGQSVKQNAPTKRIVLDSEAK